MGHPILGSANSESRVKNRLQTDSGCHQNYDDQGPKFLQFDRHQMNNLACEADEETGEPDPIPAFLVPTV
ncbi:hypothetical protein RclHR1_02320013 [Rhizophagus clarus]|uniref:Uncharacterized protein n=1 Tax=Rhizophagus clarus TaxID=94130 RepID=A0A2Z6RQA7_9GLOM|nr:hypothetical protein RclHR1_02320013 [Rhizophagus clarus]GES85884.1 hypothetical protein RCL_e9530_RclHR1_02320013 [Rhizophagus clarus]